MISGPRILIPCSQKQLKTGQSIVTIVRKLTWRAKRLIIIKSVSQRTIDEHTISYVVYSKKLLINLTQIELFVLLTTGTNRMFALSSKKPESAPKITFTILSRRLWKIPLWIDFSSKTLTSCSSKKLKKPAQPHYLFQQDVRQFINYSALTVSSPPCAVHCFERIGAVEKIHQQGIISEMPGKKRSTAN